MAAVHRAFAGGRHISRGLNSLDDVPHVVTRSPLLPIQSFSSYFSRRSSWSPVTGFYSRRGCQGIQSSFTDRVGKISARAKGNDLYVCSSPLYFCRFASASFPSQFSCFSSAGDVAGRNRWLCHSGLSTAPFWSAKSARGLQASAITWGSNIRGSPITSKHAADQFVRWLDPEERHNLQQALGDLKQELGLEDPNSSREDPPTVAQLRLVLVANSIPFIGFGFFDNGIMIVAGEYIDIKIGAALGISTMAAAALGNLISDIAGIGLAGYVEAFAAKLGFAVPPLTAKQLAMSVTKFSVHFGRCIGIIIGCLIGMFPLLFINAERDHVTSPDQAGSAK